MFISGDSGSLQLASSSQAGSCHRDSADRDSLAGSLPGPGTGSLRPTERSQVAAPLTRAVSVWLPVSRRRRTRNSSPAPHHGRREQPTAHSGWHLSPRAQLERLGNASTEVLGLGGRQRLSRLSRRRVHPDAETAGSDANHAREASAECFKVIQRAVHVDSHLLEIS